MSAIEKILCEAYEAGASDVHLTVGARPKMRLSGALVGMEHSKVLPNDTLDFLLSVMTQAQRELFEKRGGFSFAMTLPGCGRCRASAYKRGGNVALAFRLLGEKVPYPEQLGVPGTVTELCQKSSGLVLVAGVAGSGKTTTMASLINRINENRGVHIITIEEPVEYVHMHERALVDQREIGLDCNNVKEALEDALRQNPDVIMIGELKGAEVIDAALDIAGEGVLVIAGVNAQNPERAKEKLVECFELHKQDGVRNRLQNVLEAVILQKPTVTEEGGLSVAFEVTDLK